MNSVWADSTPRINSFLLSPAADKAGTGAKTDSKANFSRFIKSKREIVPPHNIFLLSVGQLGESFPCFGEKQVICVAFLLPHTFMAPNERY